MPLLNADDYAALKALYTSTSGSNWTKNSGWKNWNFNSQTPPDVTEVSNWEGVLITDDRVTSLVLVGGNLSGSLPAELGKLTSLQELALSANNLSGSLPAELGNLTSLQDLSLSSNDLNGSLPAELGDLTSLQEFYIGGNKLTGSIPTEFGNLINLQAIDLGANQLTGSIPTQLGNLTNLESLFLSSNQLTGSIPTQLGSLTKLKTLGLAFNKLSGEIPAELGNLVKLERFDLSANQLKGSIPTAVKQLLAQMPQDSIKDLDNPVAVEGDFTDKSVANGAVVSIPVTLSDLDETTDGDLSNVWASFSSSNESLFTEDSLELVGSGASRTLKFTPVVGQSGEATITLKLKGSQESYDSTIPTFKITVATGSTPTPSPTPTPDDGNPGNQPSPSPSPLPSPLPSPSPSAVPDALMPSPIPNRLPISFGNQFSAPAPRIDFKDNPGQQVKGSDKSDKLAGGSRNDTLQSGANNDTVNGKGGNDQIFTGSGNDKAKGGAGDDLMDGGTGNDQVNGGAGRDIIVGGTGKDLLTGGVGVDTFVFSGLTVRPDTITDFKVGEDRLDLRSLFAKPGYAGANTLEKFQKYVQLEQTGLGTMVKIDVDGSGAKTGYAELALLKGVALNDLTASSFIG
jgi:hypothetical protein